MTESTVASPVRQTGVLIETLPLSNRTRSRLKEAGVDSVEQLLEKSDEFLLGLRGFGHTCLRELRSVLAVLDRSFPEPLVEPADRSFPTDISEPLLSMPLANLPISNRARGVFRREKIEKVSDYLTLGSRRLLALRNFGETSFLGVNRAIAAAERTLSESGDQLLFQPPELLSSNARMMTESAQVPVAALDLPRRARRACQQMGLRTLSDLARISATDLLHRRNLGQATLRRIQSEVDRFLRQKSQLGPDTFADTLNLLLSRLQAKERQLVELREGLEDDTPRTLTGAGTMMEITESRACQIEHSAWAKLRRFSAGVMDTAAHAALRVLMKHGGVAPPEALLRDSYFNSSDLPPNYLGRMVARLLPHRLARLADGRLAAVPAATLATLAARIRKRLKRSGESLPLNRLSQEVLRGLEPSPEMRALVRALCEAIFKREVVTGPDGKTVVRTAAQGLGDDLRRILLDAQHPLHFGEIGRQLALPPYLRTELSDEKVRLRLCRDSRFVLVRRGLYDLAERFSIDPKIRVALTNRALEVLTRMKRPSSVALLGAELRNDERFASVSEFVLATVLRADQRFTHLGRGTFVPAGSGNTAVRHVSEILKSILEKNGGPMTYADLRCGVQEQRRVSDGAISATLVGRKTFLRVARGLFNLASRYPFDAARRKRLAEESILLLEDAGVVSLSKLHDSLTSIRDIKPEPPGSVLVGDLLRRQGGFLFLGGGFICLADGRLEATLQQAATRILEQEKEPLRPTTIARRLNLNEGFTALLRRVLKENPRFAAHPEGRYSLGDPRSST
ncbi:MAG: DNA-directed RNA polymerase subunit alpha C-terminal domain-containing protein [Planctomycetota bacterium]